MPQLAERTQQRQAGWAVYCPIKAAIDEATALAAAPLAGDAGQTDAEICTMAEWYEEIQFGAFAIGSDALDHGFH